LIHIWISRAINFLWNSLQALGTLSPGRRHPIHGPKGTPVPATAPPHAIVPATVSHTRVSCSGVS